MSKLNPYRISDDIWLYRSRSGKSLDFYICKVPQLGATSTVTVKARFSIKQLKTILRDLAGEVRDAER